MGFIHLSLFLSATIRPGDYQRSRAGPSPPESDRLRPIRACPGQGEPTGPLTPRSPVRGRFAGISDLRDWIAAGPAARTPGQDTLRLACSSVEPSVLLECSAGPLQVRVSPATPTATIATSTRLASFRSRRLAVAITPGPASCIRRAGPPIVRYRRARHHLLATYHPTSRGDSSNCPAQNFIDKNSCSGWSPLRCRPKSPGPGRDARSLRRVKRSTDRGVKPTPEPGSQFLRRHRPEKRFRAVDELLANADFVRFWEIKLGDMLRSADPLGNCLPTSTSVADRATEGEYRLGCIVRTS